MTLASSTSGPRPLRPFNIRLWFALASFGVILSIGIAFALLMTGFVSSRMLQREAEVTREFLESVIRAEQSAQDLFSGGDPATNTALASFAGHLRSMPDVLRANIYGKDRRILWSTDAALIGQRFGANPELEEAFGGALVTEFGTLSADSKAEHVALGTDAAGHFIEAYIPIGTPSDVQGVVELYKVPAALEIMIREGQRIIWLSAAVGALILFATLYGIVRRGAIQIERQQVELGRMEALAAVGQMASAVAHSLRNPLANIRSSAEVMRQDPTDADQGTADIIGEVDRLDQCVRELLNYARAEPAARQNIDPRELVEDCVAKQLSQLSRAKVTAEIDDRRMRRTPVAVDPSLFAQALTSIITNAVEAMPQGGRVSILLLDGPNAGGSTINVTDNGPGMAPGVLSRVSEPFFTTKTRGLGLGLALARRIVERFGGRLAIDSSEGKGTSVRIEMTGS